MSGQFYNTTHETGTVLKRAIRKADSQTAIVLEFFKKNPDKSFTPFDLQYNNVFDTNVPLTSIRRSITNLEKEGKLEKTTEKREGGYGAPNYCWKLFVPAAPKEFVQAKLF